MSFLDTSHPLRELISSVVADEGFALYDVELLSPRALRMSICSRSGQEVEALDGKTNRGVSVGDCGRVLRRLMILFQAEGEQYGLAPEPELDVSSPGINRSLRLPEHFEAAQGERIKLVLKPNRELEVEAGKVSNTLLGKIQEYREGMVTVLDEATSSPWSVSLEDIKRANVEFQFS